MSDQFNVLKNCLVSQQLYKFFQLQLFASNIAMLSDKYVISNILSVIISHRLCLYFKVAVATYFQSSSSYLIITHMSLQTSMTMSIELMKGKWQQS